MGQHVIAFKNNIDGLHIKKVGTFGVGATWPVDRLPEAVFLKAKGGDTGPNHIGRQVPIITCITPEGSEISIEDAYIPRFNHGSPPVATHKYESSKKIRKLAKTTNEDNDPPEVEDSDSDDNNSVSESEETPKLKKKKKKLKKTSDE